jgi:hypothetical protein
MPASAQIPNLDKWECNIRRFLHIFYCWGECSNFDTQRLIVMYVVWSLDSRINLSAFVLQVAVSYRPLQHKKVNKNKLWCF